jgi:hypothetical protein
MYAAGLVNHIESTWDEPALAHHCRQLAASKKAEKQIPTVLTMTALEPR